MQHSLLVVDDEKDIVDSIERQFRKQYRIFKATSGLEALRILQKETVHLILSDQRMPEMTGVKLFERAQKIQPDAIRILLTGYTDVESVIAAVNTGQIYRYITKPWDPTELDVIIKRALDSYDLRIELREKNQKLEQALKELKTLDQAKSHFMILIGHELKTPLTTISSFIDLLKEETLSADSQKYIGRISQGSDRLKEIVFDVLDLLGAETGQTRLKKSKGSINEYLTPVITELKPQVEKKSLKINTPSENTKAYFDPIIFTKVMKKILHNAVKFAEEESTIKIITKENESGVEVLVTNQGSPMDPDKVAAILKPFTLDEDIMHHSHGLGLGLSVSQSLLKHHGSSLIVKPSGKSTSIGFTLPHD